jgi:hypothetical protein
MSGNVNPLWDEFILWLALPVERRGLIASEDDWAQSKGYANARQLRRWKNDPRFVERQRELLDGLPANVVTSAPGVPADDVVGDEADYLAVRAKLFDAAKNGNLKATELFMKLYGKSWIDEETAARSSDFMGMDLDALVSETLLAVDVVAVVGVLRSRGWTVLEPEDTDAGVARVS